MNACIHLNSEGLLQKSHGGASPRAPGTHQVLDERQFERVGERGKLAQNAAGRVRDGQSLMIDAGSTTMEFARALAHAGTRITAITNSLQVAMILGTSRDARVIMTPGHYLNAEAALIGTETCAFLRRYHVDACFLGASALNDAGVSEAVEGFADVKQTMLEQSVQRYFLIDARKFGTAHLTKVAEICDIGTLITDVRPTDALAKALEQQGVEILLP
ncbi:hypothetical protein P775_22675 [Puniceibacterium antarcticum]|uniref:DeoR-like transcriptional repressor C-terminal sensor domain-containing protein n=1 Tax=Puniceibacterium antarcticum TaxID=1206336 RepID=A0A2G8R8N6_9RHOB|nr:DeoR/GlpR family DNA-binding transcription regulator [Puniceibacterium antarcticum]PIL17882.1 hypothetical protein P775_22675 [Puniceibacterium antarcticum]